jgi:AcrR family transcriptional regulator
LSRLDARSREEDITLVGLKGAALHGLGLYRAGERPMADIDLLVHPKQAQGAREVLESLGFSEAFANWKHKVFMPEVRDTHATIGEHAQNYLKIELHERIAEILPLRARDVTESVYPRSPHPGLNAYPSKAALLIHLLIHAASAMAYRALRLLHLHDIALVSARMSNADWDELLALGRNTDGPWWALPPLQLTARYYDAAVPTPVLDALAEHCQWHLRRLARHQSLSDASLSYLWIEAFPGIGWSRSLSEVMEYVASRLRPAKETLRLRKVFTQTEVALSHSEWSHLSQGQRMLRWMMSRQARADTMHAVRMALALPQ